MFIPYMLPSHVHSNLIHTTYIIFIILLILLFMKSHLFPQTYLIKIQGFTYGRWNKSIDSFISPSLPPYYMTFSWYLYKKPSLTKEKKKKTTTPYHSPLLFLSYSFSYLPLCILCTPLALSHSPSYPPHKTHISSLLHCHHPYKETNQWDTTYKETN